MAAAVDELFHVRDGFIGGLAVQVEFVARKNADSRHFIKYEWRETLCRKHLVECGETNRFWDESTLGFAPPPPRRR